MKRKRIGANRLHELAIAAKLRAELGAMAARRKGDPPAVRRARAHLRRALGAHAVASPHPGSAGRSEPFDRSVLRAVKRLRRRLDVLEGNA